MMKKKIFHQFFVFSRRNVQVYDNFLIFPRITPSDTGRYYCTATNRHGNATKAAEVIVNHNEIPEDRRTQYGRVQEVIEGETVSLECHEDRPASRVCHIYSNIN